MKRKDMWRECDIAVERQRIKEIIEKGLAYTLCSTNFDLKGYQKVDSYNYETGWGKCGKKSFMIAPNEIVSLETIWVKLDLKNYLKGD